MKILPVIRILLSFAAAILFCQCESTDGSTPDHPRIVDDRYPPGMSGTGGPQMIYGYGVSTGSEGTSSGWMANPGVLNNMGMWGR